MPSMNSIFTGIGKYAGIAGRGIGRGYAAGEGRIGRMGMVGAIGAGAGGMYGATVGRDAGQSRLGGFMSGALGGAALGMGGLYAGRAAAANGAFAGAMSRYGTARTFGASRLNAAYSSMGAINMGAAGRGIFAQMKLDARRAQSHLGPSLRSNAGNAWSAIKQGYKG